MGTYELKGVNVPGAKALGTIFFSLAYAIKHGPAWGPAWGPEKESPCLSPSFFLEFRWGSGFELRLRRPRELGDRAFPRAGSPLKKALDGIPQLQ